MPYRPSHVQNVNSAKLARFSTTLANVYPSAPLFKVLGWEIFFGLHFCIKNKFNSQRLSLPRPSASLWKTHVWVRKIRSVVVCGMFLSGYFFKVDLSGVWVSHAYTLRCWIKVLPKHLSSLQTLWKRGGMWGVFICGHVCCLRHLRRLDHQPERVQMIPSSISPDQAHWTAGAEPSAQIPPPATDI